jgi:glycosyltransferase involved in cell wall biosynthesis
VRLRFPQTDLVIAGAGPQHTALKAQSEALGLTAAVRFAGNVDRPEIFFPGASAFVLSSRHEGLPNALLEAAACGLPIVAVPSSGGVSDLLEHQCGTWLAKQITADALSATLQSALEELRPNQRFEHAFVEQFRIEPAIRAYEGLIDSVRKERIR